MRNKFLLFINHPVYDLLVRATRTKTLSFSLKEDWKFLEDWWVWALAGVVQLAGALSHNQKVEGSISGQGTYLICRLDPWSRYI